MHSSNHHQLHLADSTEDRRNRFLTPQGTDTGLGPRAASQPPHHSEQSLISSPALQHRSPSGLGGSWHVQQQQQPTQHQQRVSSGLGLNVNARSGLPSSVPTRSSSFSSHAQTVFSDAMRVSRAFGSTFEEDESPNSFDIYDDQHLSPSISMNRGRQYATDTRSRSQSLATRPGGVGTQLHGFSPNVWNDPATSSAHPLNIPGPRYGDMKPPGLSRHHHPADISNMSPFVRDVGQILHDEGFAFRDRWTGTNMPRDENGGGGSGTTSRRHSVSIVQPRRGNIIGFQASGTDSLDESSTTRVGIFQQSTFGRGGLMLTDEDLASDLGLLNLNGPSLSSSAHPPSQPSSLPIFAPLSRSPAASDCVSPFNLTIPGTSYAHRQPLNSPSDSGLSTGASPSRVHAPFDEGPYYSSSGGGGAGQSQAQLTARFIPGKGIQYVPRSQANSGNGASAGAGVNGEGAYARGGSGAGYANPVSPPGRSGPHQLYHPQPQSPLSQRRSSDASAHPPALADLGKGVPLHAVPASWPLYIVEFKAGRTDLFYLTDFGLDIRVGDLVIVEADRGKDLGKVINDSITIQEVEAFQREQLARVGFGGEPMSPGGSGGGGGPGGAKKEINPKMIYGKAQQQDTQLLLSKVQDETKALQLCQSKVRQKKLPMEVIDAEYQWDRRKLTFYFIAEKRIDFRELVRELFRLYKTRIWMASLQNPTGTLEQ